VYDNLFPEPAEPRSTRRSAIARTWASAALAAVIGLGVVGLTARTVIGDAVGPRPTAVEGGIDLAVTPLAVGPVAGELAPGRPLLRALTVRDTGPSAMRYSVSYRLVSAGPVDVGPQLAVRLVEVPGAAGCVADAVPADTTAACATGRPGVSPVDGWVPLVGGGPPRQAPRLPAVVGLQIWCLRLDLPTNADPRVVGATVTVELKFTGEQESTTP
jgi:hypothetical protein